MQDTAVAPLTTPVTAALSVRERAKRVPSSRQVNIGKLYFHLTNCLASGTFYPLNRKVNINCFSTYWYCGYCAKASDQLSPTMHLAAFTYRTFQSPAICFYCNNYDTGNKTGALIKIIDYSKGVIKQTGRHVEKISRLKVKKTI